MVTLIQGDAEHLPLADKSVDLCLGSPPYCDARTYTENGQDLGISRECDEWIEWMLKVTAEAVRVSRGLVLWVATGVTRDKCYWPACEGLMYEWWKRGGKLWRPMFWHRSGIPGSGGKAWFRADVEYVMAFKGEGDLPWSNNLACGRPPKYGPGGEMSNRLANGRRANATQWGGGASPRAFGARKKDNTLTKVGRPSHDPDKQVIANPGTLLFSTGAAGGGSLGHPLAHDNEAPFPMALAEFFLKSFVPSGGTVCDPFNGSGTTVCCADLLGMNGIGIDLRMSQIELTKKRLANPDMKFNRKPAVKEDGPGLFGEAA